jgi:serine/threonine-protein kinase
MALKTRVWSAGKLFVLLGALLVTYLVSTGVSIRLALKAREVRVPDLTSRSPNEAAALLAQLGLGLRVDESRRADPTIESGLVLAQEPPAGLTTRRQRFVTVWLSAGPRASTIPLLTGETERASYGRLSDEGITVAGVAEIRSQDYVPDVVVAQDPLPSVGATSVKLLINRTEQGASFVMPDLIGVDGDRATAILREHGFRVTIAGSTPYPGVAAGVVVRQSPQGGFQIAVGEPVSLEVSR